MTIDTSPEAVEAHARLGRASPDRVGNGMIAPHELIVDLFAGGGGASTGIFQATGRHPDIAVDHDADAIAVHTANHPTTRHEQASVWAVEPREACAGRPVGLLWASPDCFPMGTLVTTPQGQVRIENLIQGDMVLTHRGRWRRILSIATHEAETVEVRGHGHYGLVTTHNHRFYSKRITKRWPGRDPATGKRPGLMRELVENPYWPEAGAMAGKLWATPHSFPPLPIPTCKGAEFSRHFFYLLGRWLGDGSLNKGDVEICVGAHEFEEFRSLVSRAPLKNADAKIVGFRVVDHASSKLIVWGNADLGRWLFEHFGAGCEGKRVPTWCLSMQRSWREAMLRGYVDADGHVGALRTGTTTVNRNLAVSFRLLATTLGHAASLYRRDGVPGVIEGRSFVGQDIYSVLWTRDLQHTTTWCDTLHQFSPVREVKPAGVQTVVSLQVEEDESFVADGIVVHNCTHFSRAAGGRPRWKSVRSLPGVVVTWATRVRPRGIVVENVAEFQTWGPLLEDGTPCPDRAGRSFKVWVGRLRGLGYQVEWRELCAADYGAPTIRRRLFVVARCDGEPIRWPAPTHSRRPSMFESPWRSAAECIRWEVRAPSIFARARPLAEATCRRIAAGLRRFVLDAPDPFIITIDHQSNPAGVASADAPIGTITAKARHAVVAPIIGVLRNNATAAPATDPARTITAGGEHQAVIAPTLIQVGWGERDGQAPRAPGLDKPLGTVVAGGAKHAVIAAFLAQHNTGVVGRRAGEPVSTILTAGCHQQLVTAALAPDDAAGAERVAAFLVRYNGQNVGQDLREPLGALTTKPRFALVQVAGVPHAIVDIGMRMLLPEELAAAQGFPPDYRWTHPDGTPTTKTTTIRLIGNSVSPPPAAALLQALLSTGTRKAAA